MLNNTNTNDLRTELAEVDKKLARLSPAQEAMAIVRRKEIYEKIHSDPNVNEIVEELADSLEIRQVSAWLDARFATARNKGSMISEVVTITPAMAKYILDRCNIENRPVRKSKIDQYAKAMRENKFLLTAQGISFSADGKMNNGQHRLYGVISSEMPVQMYVTFGEIRDAFHVIDTGGVRGAPDSLYISGYKNVNALSASARLLKMIDDAGTGNTVYSNKDIIEFIKSHPALPEAVTTAGAIVRKFRCSIAAPTVACYYIMTRSRRPELLSSFADSLVDGSNLAKGSALLRFREGLRDKTLDMKVRDSFSRGKYVAASMIKTWNSWAYDRPLKGGSVFWANTDPFPIVI